MSSGSFHFEHNNTWNGNVPSKIIVLMVSSENYNGSYETDPFCFEHNYVNHAAFTVDNVPESGLVMELNITEKEETSKIMDPYFALLKCYPNMRLTRKQWLEIFPAFHFDINMQHTDDVLPLIRKGLTKIFFKFAKPLVKDTTFIILASFPGLLEIDSA